MTGKLTEEIDSRLVGAIIIGGEKDKLKGVIRLTVEKDGQRFESLITVINSDPEIEVKE